MRSRWQPCRGFAPQGAGAALPASPVLYREKLFATSQSRSGSPGARIREAVQGSRNSALGIFQIRCQDRAAQGREFGKTCTELEILRLGFSTTEARIARDMCFREAPAPRPCKGPVE